MVWYQSIGLKILHHICLPQKYPLTPSSQMVTLSILKFKFHFTDFTKVSLVEANEIISDSSECAEIMNNFFSDAAINLEVDRDLHTDVTEASDPVTMTIEKYKYHPSIIKLNLQKFQL